jgi:glycosyltransferase involved in cell wall biosynthesis
MPKVKSRSILLVFSDVNQSPQLQSIVKTLMLNECIPRVILIGNSQIQIRQDMSDLDVDYKHIPHRGKYSSIILFLTVSLEILRRKPSVLYASGQFASATGMVCGFFLRVPIRIFTRHHSNYHHRYNLKFGIYVDQITSKMATCIVAVSEVVKSILIEVENVPSYKVVLISNGIDLERFSKAFPTIYSEAVLERNKNSNLKIGMVARMTDWKGVEYGALAFREFVKFYPNAHLTIIGAFSDSYEKVCEALKPLPAKNFTLEEFRSDIPQFLASLNIFIHVPTGLHDEAFGIVYVEALSVGTPSIFTLSGVLQELNDPNKYAEIVPYMNSDAVLASMLKIANNVSSIQSRVPEAWIQSFSIDQMSLRYTEIILDRGRVNET